MKLLKPLISSLLVFFINYASCQTGAGGIGSASTNPMWFDANSLNLLNGNGVSTWEDISGNGNNLSQADNMRRPTFTTGTLNGLPVVNFDGTNDYLQRGATSGLGTSAVTCFMVYQRATLDAQSFINAGYSGESDKWGIYCNSSNNRLISKHKSPTNKVVFYNDAGNPSFLSSHFSASGTRTYQQGNLMHTNTSPYTAASGHNLLRVGVYNANLLSYYLQGYLAEIVVFNTALNNLERIIVENYLGNKYGFAIPTDLYAFEAGHNLGIIGIGNNGSNTHNNSRGSGVLQISAPLSMASGDYLFCGHDNVALSSFTNADMPVSLPLHQRWTRTWRAGETNDVGSLTITYHLSGGNNFGATNSYRLLVDDNGDFSNATIISGVYDGVTQTVSFNVDLSNGQYFTLAGIDQSLDIHSITNGNWSDPFTWDCNCIPTQSDNVFIDPGHTVTVDIDGEVDSLTVESTATLVMNTPVNLDIIGSLDNNGTMNLVDGSISLIGTTVQTVDGGSSGITFNDLIINNTVPSDVNFENATFILNGLMTPTSGNMNLNSANFIINSTSATTTGRLGITGGAFTYNGNFTVRRFIPAGVADYRNLSSPVIGATLATWDPDLEISCDDCPDGCAYGSNGCFMSVKRHQNNTYIPLTSISDPLTNGDGFEVWVGDDLSSFSGTTLNNTGTILTGTTNQSVSGNWHIKGNPYACPIDFDNLSFSGVGQYYYVYDASIGAYQWYDRVSATASTAELASGYVAIGQGIWMNGPGTLTITEGAKIENDAATFIRSQETVPTELFLTLRENSSTFASVMGVQTWYQGQDQLDLLDVRHLETPSQQAPSAAFVVENELIRKSYLNKDFQDKSLPMYTHFLNDGYYTFEASNIENFTDYRKALLLDNKTGDIVNLLQESQYVFYANEGVSETRFTLILTNEESIEQTPFGTASIQDNDNGYTLTQMGNVIDLNTTFNAENATVSLYNVLGQEMVYTKQTSIIEGSNIITLPNGLSGVYVLSINYDGQRITKKLVF